MTDRILVGFCLILVALLALYQVHNYDIGFHLATGRYILDQGFPSNNVLSYAQPNHSWPLHYGVSAVVLSTLFDIGGYEALSILRLALVTIAFVFVGATARMAGADMRVIVVVVALAAATAALRFQVRPHLFTYVLLSVFLHQLFAWRANDERSHLIVAGAIAVLGANLHAGAIYMLLLLLGLLACTLVSRRWPQSMTLFSCAIGIVVTALITVQLYNPMGLAGLLVPFQFGANATLKNVILEFRGIGLTSQAEYPFFWTLAALTLVGLIATQYRRDLWFWILTVAGIAAPIRHQRLLFLSAICLAPVASVVWTSWLNRKPILALKRVSAMLTAAILVVVTALAVTHYANDHVFGLGLNESEHPGGALDFLAENDVEGNAFTTDVFSGAYLERFSPHKRVFYDNRMEAYDIDFIRNAYIPIAHGLTGWRQLVDKFQIDVFILAYSTGSARTMALSTELNSDSEFVLVYFDDNSMVWIRKQSPNGLVLRNFAYESFNPDRFATTGDVNVDLMERNLRTAIKRPESPGLAWWYLALLLKDTDRSKEALQVLVDGRRKYPDDLRLITLTERLQRQGIAREANP